MGKVYDLGGNVVCRSDGISFMDNVDVSYAYDTNANTFYSIIRIYKKKPDGTLQFPFVYAPNGTNQSSGSTLDTAILDGWPLIINGGVFSTTQWPGTADGPNKPLGLLIQNGVVLQTGYAYSESNLRYPLTIDSNGDLSYAGNNADASALIANGIRQAVCGFAPIIVDYNDFDTTGVAGLDLHCQRQALGQFGNGDYAIITNEGRDFDNSTGFDQTQLKSLCKRIGLKFAYVLDGGGSTETVIGKKQINTIYEGSTGRAVPTFIVFNGTNVFGLPSD